MKTKILADFQICISVPLTVGFETNMKRKANKYKEMLKSLENKFEKRNVKVSWKLI